MSDTQTNKYLNSYTTYIESLSPLILCSLFNILSVYIITEIVFTFFFWSTAVLLELENKKTIIEIGDYKTGSKW